MVFFFTSASAASPSLNFLEVKSLLVSLVIITPTTPHWHPEKPTTESFPSHHTQETKLVGVSTWFHLVSHGARLVNVSGTVVNYGVSSESEPNIISCLFHLCFEDLIPFFRFGELFDEFHFPTFCLLKGSPQGPRQHGKAIKR